MSNCPKFSRWQGSPMEVEEALKEELDYTLQEAGTLEALAERVDRQRDMLIELVMQLPVNVSRLLLGWTEVKDD